VKTASRAKTPSNVEDARFASKRVFAALEEMLINQLAKSKPFSADLGADFRIAPSSYHHPAQESRETTKQENDAKLVKGCR
jgi:hypothetical protein